MEKYNIVEKDINLLSKNFQTKVSFFMAEVGDRIYITESYRSQERQDYLYSLGRTRK